MEHTPQEEYVGRKFRTEYVPGWRYCTRRLDLMGAGRLLARAGLAGRYAGNLSVHDNDVFWITAGGCDLRGLRDEEIVAVTGYDPESNTAYAIGGVEPSSETPMHWLIYENYRHVKAVAHAHDDLMLGEEEKARELGFVFTEKHRPYGTLELASEVVSAVGGGNDYVVIRDHGVLALGREIKEAANIILQRHEELKAAVAGR